MLAGDLERLPCVLLVRAKGEDSTVTLRTFPGGCYLGPNIGRSSRELGDGFLGLAGVTA